MNCLLKYEYSTAAVIDTTGNFDIPRLYTLILAHLQRNPDILSSLQPSNATSSPEVKGEDVAANVLDRVKIMRVFDFVGVSEAIGEIRDGLEGRKAVDTEKAKEVVEEEPSAVEAPPRRTFVADSEDEDDDEMLFASEAPVLKHAPTIQKPRPELPHKPEHNQEEQGSTSGKEDSMKIKFILIDNLAQILNPLLKKDSIQGSSQALHYQELFLF